MTLPLKILRPRAAEVPMDRLEVMRYLGYKPGVTQVEPRHQALVDEGIRLALAASELAISLGYCAVAIEGDQVATRVPGLVWRSRSLARLLDRAAGVTLVAATLGPGVEERVRQLFAAEEYALATVVDAAGSALVQGLGRLARSTVTNGTPLYGPGYGDWPITDQVALTAAAGGEAIGLRSTETSYLEPQKSLVGIIGWLAASDQRKAALEAGAGCRLCTMAGCAYRITPRPQREREEKHESTRLAR